jgi:hypothetical protein
MLKRILLLALIQPCLFWNHAAQAKQTQVPELVKKSVRQVLKQDLASMPASARRFKYEAQDLNGDGKVEHFVLFQNPYFCGSGGCTYFLFSHKGQLLTRFTVADIPIVVLTSKTKGWRDLLLFHRGQSHKLRFEGQRYPGNPSVAPPYALGMQEEEDPAIRYLFSEAQAPLAWHAF